MNSKQSKSIDHAERAHAVYAPSASDRWLNCPAFVPLCEDLQVAGNLPSSESVHTLKGTAGHELAEKVIVGWLQLDSDEVMGDVTIITDESGNEHKYNNTDLVPLIEDYVKAVRDTLKDEQELCCEAGGDQNDVLLAVEIRTEIQGSLCWGSCDVAIITPTVLHIFDLKCGTGKLVDSEGNNQLKAYAIGLCEAYDWQFTEIHVHIVQAAWREKDELPHRSTPLEVEDLQGFQIEIEQAIKASRHKKAREHAKDGDWCNWCPAYATCPAHRENALKALDMSDDIEAKIIAVDELELEQLAFILEHGKRIKKFVDEATAEAFIRMNKGKKIKGFKIVQGNANKQWDLDMFTEDEIVEKLKGLGVADPLVETEPKLMTMTEAKKQIGKGATKAIEDYLMQLPGKTTLVPESDKRQSLNIVDVLDDLDDDLDDISLD